MHLTQSSQSSPPHQRAPSPLTSVSLAGGFAEEGIKTVIPKQATAKIACRLVPAQDPDKIFKLIGTRFCHDG